MSYRLQRRFAQLVWWGEEFSSDDLTSSGAVTLDASHEPNSRNNGIGGMFSSASRDGHIVPVGVVKSKAPHRKGGMIRTWKATPSGVAWAGRTLRVYESDG